MNVQFMILGVGVLCLWQLNVLLSPECIIARNCFLSTELFMKITSHFLSKES